MGTYVTETGLKRKTLQEVRSEIEQSFKEIFGPEFETSVDSPNGLLISQLSLAFGNLWDLAFEVFTSRDPGEASGVSLDFAAALNGINRREATSCNGTAVLYTIKDSEVTIPAGSLAQRSRGNLNFSLDEDVTINPASCDRLLIVDEGIARDTDYVFHFAHPVGDLTFRWETGDSRTAAEALADSINSAGGNASIEDGIVSVTSDGSKVGISAPVPDHCSVYKGTEGIFTAVTEGTQTCEIGELDSIPRSVDGWDRVKNYESFVPGTDQETDTELRVRRAASTRSIRFKGTDASIAAHLIEEVKGVTSASVISNRTMSTDAAGRPPKSFEVLVAGGSDQEVAKNIWENQPSGIQSYGNTSVEITDSEGDGQVVSFSRAQAKYLWLKITYRRYSEEQEPTEEEIKAALVDWASQEYQLGVDVITQRVMQGLYGVNGIGNAFAQAAITDTPDGTPAYGDIADVIPVGNAEYASLVADRITLVLET